MKHHLKLFVFSAVFTLSAKPLAAAILVQDSFSGGSVNTGGTGWLGWSNWGGSLSFSSNLTVGDLQTTGQAMINTDQYAGVSREYNTISSGTVWFSWLQNNTAATNRAARVDFMKEGSTKFRIGQNKDETDTDFRIYDASGTSLVDTNISNNGTHMVAGTINLDTGDLTLYIDPTGLGLGVAPSSAATATYAFGAPMEIGQFGLSTGDSNFIFDELRLGNTWADVSPVVPEPSSIIMLGFALVTATILRRRNACNY